VICGIGAIFFVVLGFLVLRAENEEIQQEEKPKEVLVPFKSDYIELMSAS